MKKQEKNKVWVKTAHPGIFYRETKDKESGRVIDHYYVGWYAVGGQRFQVTFGSKEKHKWTPKKCADKMSEFRSNAKEGIKPRDFSEEREMEEQARLEEQRQNEERAKLAITVKQYWDKYYLPNEKLTVKQAQKKQSSLDREEGLFGLWIKPVLGDTPLNKLSFEHLLKLKTKMLKEGLAIRTVQYAFAVLRQLFNSARAMGKFEGDNPVSKHSKQLKMKVDNARKEFLTTEEADRLLKQIRKISERTYFLALFGFNTGGRFSELTRLKWRDIDFDTNFIRFRETKNKDDRYIPMNNVIREYLETLNDKIKPKKGDYVLKDRNGNKVKYVSKTYFKALKDCGLDTKNDENITFHHLRHSFASLLAQQGKVNIYELKELMGHKTLQMTMRYAKLMPKDQNLKAKLEGLNEIPKKDDESNKNTPKPENAKVLNFRRSKTA